MPSVFRCSDAACDFDWFFMFPVSSDIFIPPRCCLFVVAQHVFLYVFCLVATLGDRTFRWFLICSWKLFAIAMALVLALLMSCASLISYRFDTDAIALCVVWRYWAVRRFLSYRFGTHTGCNTKDWRAPSSNFFFYPTPDNILILLRWINRYAVAKPKTRHLLY